MTKFPYIGKTFHPYPEVQDWCSENIGDFDSDWYRLGSDPAASLFGPVADEYQFAREKDLMLFLLRWS